MKIIGLCGGSGSGKGVVSEVFLSFGIPVIDTDDVYHKLVGQPSLCLSELKLAFGEDIVKDGALDRRRLADIVFREGADPSLRQRLNSIAHKHVKEKTLELLANYEANGVKAVVIDAPLLFESGFDAMCHIIVAVVADLNTRVERIVKRDAISEDSARRRISSQIPDSSLVSRVDYVIENNGAKEELYSVVEKIIKDNIQG